MAEQWVPKSVACKTLKLSWPKLEALIRDGHVQTQKSVRRANVIYVDLNQLTEYLAQDAQVKVEVK